MRNQVDVPFLLKSRRHVCLRVLDCAFPNMNALERRPYIGFNSASVNDHNKIKKRKPE